MTGAGWRRALARAVYRTRPQCFYCGKPGGPCAEHAGGGQVTGWQRRRAVPFWIAEWVDPRWTLPAGPINPRSQDTPVWWGVDVLLPDGTHLYWSTHCRHGNHAACSATELAPGLPRQPAQCKTCGAPCRCPHCHHEQETPS